MWPEKKRWEVKTKSSQHILRGVSSRGRNLITRSTITSIRRRKITPVFDASLDMRKDIILQNVPRINKASRTRRRGITGRDIMPMLSKIINLPRRRLEKKVKTLQVTMNMS